MHSLDGVQRNIELIGKLFPNAITEVKRNGKVEHAIDFDVLRQELSDSIVEGREERYQFTWPDKKKAMLAANAPITATLRPVVADSVGKDGTSGGFDSENLYIEGDNLETVLLNLTRGTGLAGLCGIPPRRERFIRPMLAVSRAEIEAYLAQNGLSHVTDSTNFLPDARRNRLRQSVIPLLKAENPSLCETAFRMCRLLEADEAQLSAQAEAALRQARLSDGIRCSALTAYPAAVRTRAVKLLLGEIHAPKLSERHISAVDRLLFSECPSARASLPGGFSAQREYDRLLLTAGSPAAFEPVTLLAGESAVLQPLGLRIFCEWQENFSEIQNTLSTFAVKCDTIGSTTQILFRPRRAHDEMRVSGGRKTLKKLMIDRKIPLDRRGLLPVAADEHGILGVYGIGVNLDRAAAPGDRAVIIRIEELEKEDSLYD